MDDDFLEAVVAEEYAEEAETRGKITAVVVVAVLIIASLSAYYIFFRDDEEPPIPDALEAKISVLSENVNVGENVHFDASNSTGDIISYKWDFDYNYDSNGDGNPRNDVDAQGLTVQHTYSEPGDYKISLTVDNGTGTSKDTVFIHVGYFGEFSGTVGSTHHSETFRFTLSQTQGAKNFSAVITYPSGSPSRNNITLYIYDGNNTPGAEPVADTEGDQKEGGAEQTETIYITNFQEIAGWWPGEFTAEVRWVSPLTAFAIPFELRIEVYY